MQPIDVQFVVGLSGYFVKDLQAVRQSPQYNPLRDDNIPPRTPGFKSVVQPGQIISILLHLPIGGVAVGDCVDVIFSGAASRDPLFVADEHLEVLESVVRPWLLGCDISSFRRNGEKVESGWLGLHTRSKLHSAIRYGLTQALLAATAQVHGCTIAEVISHEWGTRISNRPIDILASCHRNDTLQLDRMIMKQASLLPHASFVHRSDVGLDGSILVDYVRFVAGRVRARGCSGYWPRLHFDVYGTLGDLFPQLDQLAAFLDKLAHAAQPYDILIESPIIASSKAEQIRRLVELRMLLLQNSIRVKTVADEWCNTLEDIKEFADAGAVDYVQIKMPDLGGIDNSIEAVLYCGVKGTGCCLGGSANETEISARITAQVALATNPDFLLSKPGIGADEGLTILTNEMLRGIALTKRRLSRI